MLCVRLKRTAVCALALSVICRVLPCFSCATFSLQSCTENPDYKELFKTNNASFGPEAQFYFGQDQAGSNCYLVRLAQQTSSRVGRKIRSLIASLGGEVRRTYSSLQKSLLVCFKCNRIPLEELSAVKWIEFVEKDQRITAQQVQTSAPWGLRRIGPFQSFDKTGYSFTKTGKGVNVYLLDSGVATKHPGCRIIENAQDDCSGHGTQVASIIAGINTGVAKRARIVAVKILDCEGQGENSDLVHAIHWVIKNHQKPALINMSVGGSQSRSVDDAVKLAIRHGIPVVVAAGNGRMNACGQSPSNIMGAITVAASNERDERARFSNFGACVDIFAPGVGILTASASSSDKRGWGFASGTSMSAPFVSGVVAQILEGEPTLSVQDVFLRLQRWALKGRLDQNTLLGSPNALVQSAPCGPDDAKLVDLAPSQALPSRPFEDFIPTPVETVLIVCSVVVAVLSTTATFLLAFKGLSWF